MPPAHSGDIVMRVTLANVVAVLTALFFIAGGYTNLFPPEAVVQDYERWGYPGWFSRITGILEREKNDWKFAQIHASIGAPT